MYLFNIIVAVDIRLYTLSQTRDIWLNIWVVYSGNEKVVHTIPCTLCAIYYHNVYVACFLWDCDHALQEKNYSKLCRCSFLLTSCSISRGQIHWCEQNQTVQTAKSCNGCMRSQNHMSMMGVWRTGPNQHTVPKATQAVAVPCLWHHSCSIGSYTSWCALAGHASLPSFHV
jgi:hypothetical protein